MQLMFCISSGSNLYYSHPSIYIRGYTDLSEALFTPVSLPADIVTLISIAFAVFMSY
jgi:hypothetical protein